MDITTLNALITDKIQDTGSIITDAARDRALTVVLTEFNHQTAKTVVITDLSTATDYEWHQIADLTAAMLLNHMAAHVVGDFTASALGNAPAQEHSKAQEYRTAANRLRKAAYVNLGIQDPVTQKTTLKPASIHVEVSQ